MHDPAITRPVHDARHEDVAWKVGRNNEAAIHIFSRGRHCEIGAGVEDQVGSTQGPAVGKLAWRREVGRFALRRVGVDPFGEGRNLGARQRPVPSESQSEVRHGLPRGHSASRDDVRDVGGAFAGLLVSLQAKRRDLTLAVAFQAMTLQDRCDVLAIGRRGFVAAGRCADKAFGRGQNDATEQGRWNCHEAQIKPEQDRAFRSHLVPRRAVQFRASRPKQLRSVLVATRPDLPFLTIEHAASQAR